jgi:hypothetical protein
MSIFGKTTTKPFHPNIPTKTETQKGKAWMEIYFNGSENGYKITAIWKLIIINCHPRNLVLINFRNFYFIVFVPHFSSLYESI